MNSESAAPSRAAEAPPKSAKEITKRRWDHVVGYHLLARLARLWFRAYASWQVIGIENVPKSGPLLIAANHASNVDPIMGWAAIYGTRRMWGVSKSELWDNSASSYLMACIGTIPARRGTADRPLIRRALELLSVGEAVGIFPEGTRSHDGKLNAPQPGIALLIQRSGATVLPVGIVGTHEMLPRGAKKMKRVKLKIAFGKPLTFPPDAKRDTMLNAIMTAIAELLTANGQPTEPPAPDRKPLTED